MHWPTLFNDARAAKVCYPFQMHSADQDPPIDCLFCGIASGEVEAHEVYRDDRIVAFLDNGPIRDGHIQIIPVEHIESFELLPPDLGSAILHLAQRIALVQKRLYSVERVAFLFTGGDIPHAHAHVVPMFDKTDITSRRYIKERKLTWVAPERPEATALRDTASAIAEGLCGSAR